MEDLVVSYNGCILNANGDVVQPTYGNGLDPSKMVLSGGKQSFVNPLTIIEQINAEVEIMC